MRIGLIADTHMPGSIEKLWPQAFELLHTADCILHAGDLHTLDIVDELSALAPTYVARGNGDEGIVDDRLQDTWLLELKGLRIGMIHHFPSPARKSREKIDRYVDMHFQTRPDVLVYGHTHLEEMHQLGEMLCINPGSPTLPRNQSLRLGTVGLLELSEPGATATIFQLTEHGIEHHADLAPITHAVTTASL